MSDINSPETTPIPLREAFGAKPFHFTDANMLLPFAGPAICEEIAYAIARGEAVEIISPAYSPAHLYINGTLKLTSAKTIDVFPTP